MSCKRSWRKQTYTGNFMSQIQLYFHFFKFFYIISMFYLRCVRPCIPANLAPISVTKLFRLSWKEPGSNCQESVEWFSLIIYLFPSQSSHVFIPVLIKLSDLIFSAVPSLLYPGVPWAGFGLNCSTLRVLRFLPAEVRSSASPSLVHKL